MGSLTRREFVARVGKAGLSIAAAGVISAALYDKHGPEVGAYRGELDSGQGLGNVDGHAVGEGVERATGGAATDFSGVGQGLTISSCAIGLFGIIVSTTGKGQGQGQDSDQENGSSQQLSGSGDQKILHCRVPFEH